MLIDFTVENYRSIKGPVTLSAVAEKGRGSASPGKNAGRDHIKADNDIAPAFPVAGRGFEILPVLGIFGANASGKSNVLKALDSLATFMVEGNWKRKEVIPNLGSCFTPFRLNVAHSSLPTKFALRVVIAGVIYAYSLSTKKSRILLEELTHWRLGSKRPRRLFQRSWEEQTGKTIWKNGSDFSGPHVQLQQQIQEDEPYFSLLASHLQVDVVESLSSWLRTRWQGVDAGQERQDRDRVVRMLAEQAQLTHPHQHRLRDVIRIIRKFDTGVADLRFRKVEKNSGADEIQAFAVHDTENVRASLPMEEESAGTQRLLVLAYKMLEAFDTGTPLLLDELGSNIHPNVSREIVSLFQDPKTNPKRAQLIFTSHDNTLLRRNLLRRDQIWFTQKREDGSTDLYPLSDFHPRNDLAVDRAYLDGRFEAVPILPRTQDLLGGLLDEAEPEAVAS